MSQKNKQKGLSLIELLIAILISSILLVAVVNLYIGFGRSSEDKKALSTAQDKANFALNELARQVRMSGAGLCLKTTENLVMNPNLNQVVGNVYADIPLVQNSTTFNDISLRSYHSPTSAQLDTTLSVEPNSDALLVSFSSPRTLTIEGAKGGKSVTNLKGTDMQQLRYLPIMLSSPLGQIVQQGESNIWLMLSDCQWTELVYYESLDITKKELPAPISASYRSRFGFGHAFPRGLVGRLESKLYFVAEGSDGWALYERDLMAKTGEPAVELMDGVTGMTVEYLEKIGSDFVWRRAAKTTPPTRDWDQEVPVRITLTMDEGGEAGERRVFTRIIDPRN